MKNHSTRINIQILVASFAMFATAVVGATAFYLHFAATVAAYTEQEQLIADTEEKERAAAELRQVLEDSSEERAALDEYFLDVVQVAEFLEMVEQFAADNGIVMDSQELRTTDANDHGIAMVRVPYEIQGSDQAVTRFLEMMETLPYQSEVRSVHIQRADTPDGGSRALIEVAISYIDHD